MNTTEIELVNIDQEIQSIKKAMREFDKFIYSTLLIGIIWMCAKVKENGFSIDDIILIAVVALGSFLLVFVRQWSYKKEIKSLEIKKDELLSVAKKNMPQLETMKNKTDADFCIESKSPIQK